MALPTSGPLSLDDIAGEFGGTTPHSISEYYGVAAGIPTSGTISIADFYGASSGPSTLYVFRQSGNSFYVIDAANPASMSILSTVTDATNIGASYMGFVVNFSSNKLYLSGLSPTVVAIYDTSNKASLSLLGTIAIPNYGSIAVDASDTTLYHSVYNNARIDTWDVTNPASPSNMGFYQYLFSPYTQEVIGSHVIVTEAGIPGMASITATATPSLASQVVFSGANSPLQNPFLAFDETTNYFWWTNPWYYSDFLLYCDASNPASLTVGPQFVDGNFNQSRAVLADDSIVYIWMHGTKTLHCYDVSSPNSPVHLGSITRTSIANVQSNGMFKLGDTIFIADYTNGTIESINVSNPSSPSYISTLTGLTNPLAIRA